MKPHDGPHKGVRAAVALDVRIPKGFNGYTDSNTGDKPENVIGDHDKKNDECRPTGVGVGEDSKVEEEIGDFREAEADLVELFI